MYIESNRDFGFCFGGILFTEVYLTGIRLILSIQVGKIDFLWLHLPVKIFFNILRE